MNKREIKLANSLTISTLDNAKEIEVVMYAGPLHGKVIKLKNDHADYVAHIDGGAYRYVFDHIHCEIISPNRIVDRGLVYRYVTP